MAPTLDATLAGANANSYQTVATADAYFLNSLYGSQWTALSSDVKAQALITAAQWLETLKYVGIRCGTVQRLQWPRQKQQVSYFSPVVFPQDVTNEPYPTCDVIPKEMLQAQAELALQLGTDPTLMNWGIGKSMLGENGPVKRQKLDALEVEYFDPRSVPGGTRQYGIGNNAPLLFQKLPWLKPLISYWLVNAGGQVVNKVRS
jgi:hypothetical protein